MNIHEKLLNIQANLKAPKGQFNKFGNYAYRSCEDIVEAVKPLLVKFKATLTIQDTVELIGDRYYIKATAELHDTESNEAHRVSAYAREADDKKGMDSSQITGSTSSYARKYALNGLFAIDDTKDADGLNKHGKDEEDDEPKKPTEVYRPKVTDETLAKLISLTTADEQDKAVKFFKVEKLADITEESAKQMIAKKGKK